MNSKRGVIAGRQPQPGPGSPFAGGAVIRQHGFRPSEHLDIFAVSSKRLNELARADRSALESAGYAVRPGRAAMMVSVSAWS